MDNPWHDLQDAVKARLAGASYFVDIPIVTEDAGDVETAVTTALARGAVAANPLTPTKVGVAILVLTPRASGVETTRTHLLTDTTVRVAVFEQGVVNRSTTGIQKPALDVLWNLVCLIQGSRSNTGAVPARLATWDSDEDPDAGVLSYFADFEFRQSLRLTP
jgi:hypothetical protein